MNMHEPQVLNYILVLLKRDLIFIVEILILFIPLLKNMKNINLLIDMT